jgi:hypothetical protein
LLSTAAAAEGPDARLDRLIAASQLDRTALAARAASDPAIVFQALDPASRAALALLLAFPPGEIRRVRDGQAVIRTAGEWSDAEWQALTRLADQVGTNPQKVTQVRATVSGGELVRVELAGKRDTVGVGIAWPDTWRRAEVVETIDAELGIALPQLPVTLIDPSFEDEHALGVAWTTHTPVLTTVSRDTARVHAGKASIRMERVRGARQSPGVSQGIDVRPGDRVVFSGWAAPERGAVVVASLAFDTRLSKEGTSAATTGVGGWERLAFSMVVPEGASHAEIWLEQVTGSASNVDDLVLTVDTGAPSPVAMWQPTTQGAVTVLADLTRVTEPAALAAHLEWALLAGLGDLSLAPQGRADVYAYADEAHQRAVTGGVDDPAAGTCWVVSGSPWAGACPVAVMVTRAWGPAGNPVMGVGLPRALAGSGQDLDAAARPGLAGVPRMGALATSWRGTPEEVAAATSFAAWLLRTQSIAAARAAWQAASLDGYRAAGRDLGALDAAWRASVGP